MLMRRYLQRYKKTGKCTVMHTTRVVTALHREVKGQRCGVPAGDRCWRCTGTRLHRRQSRLLPSPHTRRAPQGHSFPLSLSLKEVKQGDTKAYMVRPQGVG